MASKPEETKAKNLQKSLIEYKLKLSQVSSLLQNEEKQPNPNEIKIEEMKIMANKLRQAIISQEKLISESNNEMKQTKEKTEENTIETINVGNVDNICQGYYEKDKKWYAAHIIDVNEATQTAEVIWIGFKERSILHAKHIKIVKPPEPIDLGEGIICDAIYKEDGEWHKCKIDRVLPEGYLVSFKKIGAKVIVPREYLRLNVQSKNKIQEFENLINFKTPDALKIKTTDNEQQKKAKKKKLKAIKQKLKIKALDKLNKEKQDNWLKFNQKATESKKGYFFHKKPSSMFTTSDSVKSKVGVINSGNIMTPNPLHQNPHKPKENDDNQQD